MIRPSRGARAGARLAAVAAFALLQACAPAHDARQLFEDLQNPDLEARQDAEQKLDSIVRQGDYQVFLRGLDSPNRLHQAQSIVFLARMPQPEARAALRGLLRVDQRRMLPFNPIKMKPTRGPDSDSRILVAHLIAEGGGDAEALESLTGGVDDNASTETLTGTCFAVGALGDPAGVPFLAGLARDARAEVARAAVQALGRFRGPEVVAALQAAAGHDSPQVRADVLSSLAAIDAAATNDLLRTMASSDPASDIREMAIRQLGSSGDPAVVPFLIDRLRDRDDAARMVAREVLTGLAGRDLGAGPERWRQWWARDGKRLLANR